MIFFMSKHFSITQQKTYELLFTSLKYYKLHNLISPFIGQVILKFSIVKFYCEVFYDTFFTLNEIYEMHWKFAMNEMHFYKEIEKNQIKKEPKIKFEYKDKKINAWMNLVCIDKLIIKTSGCQLGLV